MAQFYFHVRSNGRLNRDERGRQCNNRASALEYAVKSMPALLRKNLQRAKTYVSTQVCDDEDRTIAVIRTTLVIEKWGGRPFNPHPAPRRSGQAAYS
jgi:hypothetical protein